MQFDDGVAAVVGDGGVVIVDGAADDGDDDVECQILMLAMDKVHSVRN